MGKLFQKMKNGLTIDDEEYLYDEDYEEELDEEASEDEESELYDEDEDEDCEEAYDDAYDEEYEDEEYDEAAYRRMERHKRRVRNQILAYVTVVLVLVLIGVGGYFGVSSLINRIPKPVEEDPVAAQLSELAEAEEEIVIEAPEVEVEETTPQDYLEEIITSCLSEMPLEDKVAQLFMITPEALTGVNTATKAGDGTKDALNQCAVGGLVYFSKNIVDKEQLMEMLANTKNASKYPMFLAVDEEGGEVSRVANSKIEVTKTDSLLTIGESGDASTAKQSGETIGTYLSELGFNLDFAPVADVVTDAKESDIGERSFGADPAVTGEMVANMVQGIEEAGVSACLKHFPGIGDSKDDSHETRVEIEKSLEELKETDFVSFQAGIDAGVDFVMVSHATLTEADDSNLPACLSKTVVDDYLREELGYEGIVITDALNMGAITEYYATDEACIKALQAGVDILLMPDDFETAYEAVLAAVEAGDISEERIEESLRRIYRVKFADKVEQ